MNFVDIFTNYLDMVVTGFIGGLAVYLMSNHYKNIRSKLLVAILIYLLILITVLTYSLFVYLSPYL